MEPRKEVLKKTPEQSKGERKNHFQIMKLEERIAPRNHHEYCNRQDAMYPYCSR